MPNHPDLDPHEKHEVDERWDAVDRRHTAFGIGGAILLLAVIGLGVLAWRAYPEFRRHAAALTSLPSIQQMVDGMGDRFKDVNAKLAEWAGDRQTLNDRMTKLGQGMEARYENMRKQVEQISADTIRRVEAEIESKAQALDARLERLESGRNSDQTRVAELQRDLNDVREQMKGEFARQADELNAVRRDLQDQGAKEERQIAGLTDKQERGQRDVTSIQQKLAVQRVDFEVTRNRMRQLTENISLDVTHTNPEYRNVSGWLWVLPEGRTIWLKNQAVQQPVVFYGYKDGKKRELVFTNVTSDSVTGYLLLPQDAQAPAQAGAASGGE